MKLKSHYYLARLVYNEIKSTSYLNFKGMRCALAEGMYNAIIENEASFNAGAIGPDIYPDMFVGMLRVHPKKNINPALWLAMMNEEFRNNYDYRSEQGKEVLAFIAGWTVHCASDVVMNTFINHTVSDWSMKDARTAPVSKEEKEIASAVESYIDAKVSQSSLLREIKVKAPDDFLKRFFIEDRYSCFSSAGSRAEFIMKKPKEEKDSSISKETKKEAPDTKDTKSEAPQVKEEADYDDISMLDFSEDTQDVLILLGDIRRVLLYDDNAPFEEQEELGKVDKEKTNRMPYLKKADKLIDNWMEIWEELAEKLLSVNSGENANDSFIKGVEGQLTSFQKELISLLSACRKILSLDGIPQWLLDYMLRKNFLDMPSLTGALPIGAGNIKGEITVKITGPFAPVVTQTNRLIDNMISEVVPKMIKDSKKSIESFLKESKFEKVIEQYCNKDELDKNLGDIGKAVLPVGETSVPFADAITLAKLCLLGKSFNELVNVVHSSSPLVIRALYENPGKGEFKTAKPKNYPDVTKRLRLSVHLGDIRSVESFGILYGEDSNELAVKKLSDSWHSYIQFDKLTQITSLNEISLSVKGVSPEDSFVISVEAEDLRIEEKWKDLVLISGSLTAASECDVFYTDNIPENVEKTTPKVSIEDGVANITVPITYKKKEEKKEGKEKSGNKGKKAGFDFDVGTLAFVRSLESGKEWMQLENDNPPYFYFLHALMRLTYDCYR